MSKRHLLLEAMNWFLTPRDQTPSADLSSLEAISELDIKSALDRHKQATDQHLRELERLEKEKKRKRQQAARSNPSETDLHSGYREEQRLNAKIALAMEMFFEHHSRLAMCHQHLVLKEYQAVLAPLDETGWNLSVLQKEVVVLRKRQRELLASLSFPASGENLGEFHDGLKRFRMELEAMRAGMEADEQTSDDEPPEGHQAIQV